MKRNYARWRKQGAPGWLLIYTIEGLARFAHERGEFRARAGDLVLIPPHASQDYGLASDPGRWDLLWAYFFPPTGWLSLLQWPEEAPNLRRLRLSDAKIRSKIVQLLSESHRYQIGAQRHREMFAMNALERALLLCDAINPRSEQSGMDPRVLRAMDYLCQNLSEPITLAMLAQLLGLSVSRLGQLFREHTRESPLRFLEAQRIARAQQLLELTHEPVMAIAGAVGFSDAFHFSHRFKQHLGCSPRHYRQRRLASASG